MSAADRIAAARAMIEPLTGHTPGPWHFHGPIKGRKMWCLELDSDTNFVADLWRPNVDANASLIAAAPALRDTVAALIDLADAQAQEIERLRGLLNDERLLAVLGHAEDTAPSAIWAGMPSWFEDVSADLGSAP